MDISPDTIEKDQILPDELTPEPHDVSSLERSPRIPSASLITVTTWLPLIKKLSINLFIPFLNGIMLGFGEIFAHELGMLLGWRSARGFDPSSMPPATNPKARRRWLFGIF